jgi:hypothetical protein
MREINYSLTKADGKVRNASKSSFTNLLILIIETSRCERKFIFNEYHKVAVEIHTLYCCGKSLNSKSVKDQLDGNIQWITR